MTASTVPTHRVDVWELRCHYKKGQYPQRVAAQEFSLERSRANPAHKKYNLGPGGLSVTHYYYDKTTNQQVLEVHRLEYADGSLGHREPDPKLVLHDGVLYKRVGGSDNTLREPELKYPRLWQRRMYGCWRKLRCFFLGPRTVD